LRVEITLCCEVRNLENGQYDQELMATSTSIQFNYPDQIATATMSNIKHQTASLGVLEIEQVLTVNCEGEAKGKGGLRISKKMGFLKDLLELQMLL
jgi:hypothetical protein